MGSIYSIDSERSLFIYPYHQAIYLRILSGERIGKPSLLCSDYATDLSGVLHKNALYFAYQNTQGELLVKNISDPGFLFRISSLEADSCSHPVLFQSGQELLLVYITENPFRMEYSLKCASPLNSQKGCTISESFSEIPAFTGQSVSTGLLLWINVHSRKLLFFLTPELSLIPLEPALPLKERIHKLQAELEDQKDQKASLEHTIRDISGQYEQLMDTARQYRNDAKKWYDKYRDLAAISPQIRSQSKSNL